MGDEGTGGISGKRSTPPRSGLLQMKRDGVGNEGDRWDKICMIKENPEGEECGK